MDVAATELFSVAGAKHEHSSDIGSSIDRAVWKQICLPGSHVFGELRGRLCIADRKNLSRIVKPGSKPTDKIRAGGSAGQPYGRFGPIFLVQARARGGWPPDLSSLNAGFLAGNDNSRILSGTEAT